MGFAEGDHQPREAENVGMRFEPIPVEPGGRVLLIVRIVVPALGLEELIARAQHRRAVGEQEQAQEVLGLALAQRDHLGGRPAVTIESGIPADVRRPVRVAVAVRHVAFRVVGEQVPERESVVRGHVVDALIRVIGARQIIREEVAASVQSLHHHANHSRVAAHEPPHVVAEPGVPLRPGDAGEIPAELVRAGSVPRLRDQTQPRQLGVGRDLAEDRRFLVAEGAVGVPGED